MKNLKKQSGFSLAELMVSLGIASAITLLVMSTIKLSSNTKKTLERTTEVNSLIQKVTAELSRKEVCEKNFKPNAPITTITPTAVPQNLVSITNKSGKAIITANTNYGELIRPITTITYSGVVSGNNPRLFKMNVVVGYQPVADSGQTITPKQFSIPINVFLDANGRIDTCYADIQSLLEKAVENSCQGNGATYYAKDATYVYGHCEHEAEIRDSANNVALTCPAGELLQAVDVTTSNPDGKMIFRCAKFSTATSCPAWNYLKGVDTNGNAICEDIRTLFPASGFAVLRNGTYSVQNISCPAGQILQRIDASNNVVCVNPRLNYTCPVGQYVTGIDASGSPICSYASNQNACSAGYYMTRIDSVGNVTCALPALNGSCSGNNVITGVDASGTVICSPNQP